MRKIPQPPTEENPIRPPSEPLPPFEEWPQTSQDLFYRWFVEAVEGKR